jgi:hypothetical protein
MLLCQRNEIFVKIGISDDPLKRLTSILVGCPLTPGILAATRLANRRIAQQAETAVHEALFGFRVRGEWFCFKPTDKPEFNRLLQSALAEFSSPSLPVEWAKINVEQMMAQKRQAVYVARKRTEQNRRLAKRYGADERFAQC